MCTKFSVSIIDTSIRYGVCNCVSIINCSDHRFVNEAFDVHVLIVSVLLFVYVADANIIMKL
jgi:hypothetical protein